MGIIFFDLTSQYRSIKKEIDSAVKRVLQSGGFIGGKEVERLEKEVAKLCGAKYGIGVNSGTDALFLSLKALGVGQGDEVVTTPFTFIATAEAIANLGARPVFADIQSDTLNINPAEIETAVTTKTKAILPVHLFGQTADMPKIMRIARKRRLRVIEDAAQSLGAAPLRGDCACLSFFPSKNLGACGDGGMVVTNQKKIADKIRLLRNHGSSPQDKYLNLVLGVNSRLDALQAAVLRVKLRRLKEWNRKRREKAKFYHQELEGLVEVPRLKPSHVFHQYTLRTKFRDRLRKHLKERGIPTRIYYPLPLHLQPAFKYLKYKRGDFPQAERAAKEVLSLPIYPELPLAHQKKIIQAILEFFYD